jgi:hypothetical protein
VVVGWFWGKDDIKANTLATLLFCYLVYEVEYPPPPLEFIYVKLQFKNLLLFNS